MALALSTTVRDGVSILAVTGDIDIRTAPELGDAVDALLAGGARKIAIDLSGVDFLDSSALGTLVGIAKRTDQTDGMRIVCPKPNLVRLFEVTRLTELFTLVRSVDEIRS